MSRVTQHRLKLCKDVISQLTKMLRVCLSNEHLSIIEMPYAQIIILSYTRKRVTRSTESISISFLLAVLAGIDTVMRMIDKIEPGRESKHEA